jgi:hypothetical protein
MGEGPFGLIPEVAWADFRARFLAGVPGDAVDAWLRRRTDYVVAFASRDPEARYDIVVDVFVGPDWPTKDLAGVRDHPCVSGSELMPPLYPVCYARRPD